MRILTVRQPWAWAIIHGGKDVENRTRNLAGDYRGPVAIHVATAMPFSAALRTVQERTGSWPQLTGNPIGAEHPGGILNAGHIIGVVDLVDVHHADSAGCATAPLERAVDGEWDRPCSAWAEAGVHHLVLTKPRPLVEPIRYRGALGLRELDTETISLIEAAIA